MRYGWRLFGTGNGFKIIFKWQIPPKPRGMRVVFVRMGIETVCGDRWFNVFG